jgi:biopolymer transport protein ExbD
MRRTRRRSAQGGRNQLTDISLTPLIDTALTLLVIFMITTPMIQNAIKVNLPRGHAKEDSGSKQELIVFIDDKNNFYFNGAKLAEKKLIESIKKEVGAQKERTVYVKADKAVSYGRVLELVDDIKVIGGVQYVALATSQRT